MRPAGAINASASDMAAYLQFYLNRGAANERQVVPFADIDRMESPKSTWAGKEGLKAGYGLSNFWSVEDGFVYHGHDGEIDGGLTELSYMPDYGVDIFSASRTAKSRNASKKSAKRSRLTVSRPPEPDRHQVVHVIDQCRDYTRWYRPDSPRTSTPFYSTPGASQPGSGSKTAGGLLSPRKLAPDFFPVERTQFSSPHIDQPPDPVATVALVRPNARGWFVQPIRSLP